MVQQHNGITDFGCLFHIFIAISTLGLFCFPFICLLIWSDSKIPIDFQIQIHINSIGFRKINNIFSMNLGMKRIILAVHSIEKQIRSNFQQIHGILRINTVINSFFRTWAGLGECFFGIGKVFSPVDIVF